MVRIEIENRQLVVRMNLFEQVASLCFKNPRIDLRDVVKVFAVRRIWHETLDPPKKAAHGRRVEFPWWEFRRGAPDRIFLSSVLMHCKRGRAIVIAYGDKPGVVVDIDPVSTRYSMVAVTVDDPNSLVRSLSRAIE